MVRMGVAMISVILVIAMAGIVSAASEVEVNGNLKISGGGTVTYPDGSNQTTGLPEVYSHTGEFIGISLDANTQVYIPSIKKGAYLDLQTGNVSCIWVYYTGASCTGTAYLSYMNRHRLVRSCKASPAHYKGDDLATPASFSINSYASSSGCINYVNGDCNGGGNPPCLTTNLIPAVLADPLPFTTPINLPLQFD